MYEDLLGKKKESQKPQVRGKMFTLRHDESFKLRIHKVGKETAVYIMKKGKWRLIDSIADFGDYDIEWSEYQSEGGMTRYKTTHGSINKR